MEDIQKREIETSEKLVKRYEVTFPQAVVQPVVNVKLKEKQKSAKEPGFREGQVPFFVVERKYKKSLTQDAIKEKMQEVVFELTESFKDKVLGKPKIEDFKEENGAVSFRFSVELFPEFDMPDFSSIDIEHYNIKVLDSDIDDYIGLIARAKRQIDEETPKEDPIKMGDSVLINCNFFLDGKLLENRKIENKYVDIGYSSILKEMTDGLMGRKVGDTPEFEVTFPYEEMDKEIAGKKCLAKVEILDVRRYLETPAIDQAFAEQYGCASVAELRYRVSGLLRDTAYEDLFGVNKAKLFDSLEKMLDFDVPTSIFEEEYSGLLKNEELKKHLSLNQDDYQQYCRNLAMRKMRIGLLLSEYTKRNNIRVSEEELQRHIDGEIRKFPDRKEQILKYYKENVSLVYSNHLEQKAVSNVLSVEVNLVESDKTLSEVKKIVNSAKQSLANRN
ncbi:trigger factor [Candidatus Sneabacter namystus]|uniref:Trigger factor n=1 Tax=Candidatus Sneabacter namystus TaxID=2601646 RepID=A0A5C0UIQ2_9RICK|nr:trigger factor [Candidatus Sneabacter namystus]QEK39393.1 trigger factor [Candidatus Sneabacter namystus]